MRRSCSSSTSGRHIGVCPIGGKLETVIGESPVEKHRKEIGWKSRPQITELPPEILEGKFGFFSRAEIDALPIPETDRTALWPIYDSYRDSFVALKADCAPHRPVRVEIEEITPKPV